MMKLLWPCRQCHRSYDARPGTHCGRLQGSHDFEEATRFPAVCFALASQSRELSGARRSPARRSGARQSYSTRPDHQARPVTATLHEIERRLDETRFCWIGGVTEDDTFYYRIQSPVILIEFDQHSGVFLANQDPARFHIHTIVRSPNGNDYGIDLLRLHYELARGASHLGD